MTAPQIFLWLAIINSLSCILVSCWHYFRDNIADLQHPVPHRPCDTRTYLIAGNLNRPNNAFRFLEPELSGNVVHVQFRLIGWNASVAADQILADIRATRPRKVIVYAISLGDKVARFLEKAPDDSYELQIIAINPCSDINFLVPPLNFLLIFGAPLFEILCFVLGWFSIIPLIPAPSGNYSLKLLANQYFSIACETAALYGHRHTIGVVCSELPGKPETDGLLNNRKIRKYFSQTHIENIQTNHGDTAGEPDKYLQAVQKILDSHK